MANSEMTCGTMDVCGVLCAAFSFFQLAIYRLKRKLQKANFSTYKSSFLVSEMRMALHLLNPYCLVNFVLTTGVLTLGVIQAGRGGNRTEVPSLCHAGFEALIDS